MFRLLYTPHQKGYLLEGKSTESFQVVLICSIHDWLRYKRKLVLKLMCITFTHILKRKKSKLQTPPVHKQTTKIQNV